MKPQCQISVAMATYNGARFLREQLESLARQSLTPAELVACDDGSTDDTMSILQEFGRQSSFPVRVHRNPERLHYGSNFLKAASLCTGDYVAFCDQDDIWLERKLEVSAAALRRHRAVLCSHPFIPVDQHARPLSNRQSKRHELVLTGGEMEPWDVFYGFTCMVDRRVLELIPWQRRSIDLIDETKLSAHDRWIYFLAASTGLSVVLPDALALYRQHGNNTYGDRRIGWRHKLERVRNKYRLYLEKRRRIASSNVSLLTAVDCSYGDMLPHLSEAVARWARLSQEYEERSAVFRDGDRLSRLVQYGRCASRGTYGKRIGGAGMKTACEDLVAVALSKP
jgi:glycosyltransferase involved in cell wall biosynthesis